MKHPIIFGFGPVNFELTFEDDDSQRTELTDEELTNIGNGIAEALKGLDVRTAHSIMHQLNAPMCAMMHSNVLDALVSEVLGEAEPQGASPEGSDETAPKPIPKHLH